MNDIPPDHHEALPEAEKSDATVIRYQAETTRTIVPVFYCGVQRHLTFSPETTALLNRFILGGDIGPIKLTVNILGTLLEKMKTQDYVTPTEIAESISRRPVTVWQKLVSLHRQKKTHFQFERRETGWRITLL